MMRPAVLMLLFLSSPAAIDAQPAKTRLDTAAATPSIDDKSQTEDVRFSSRDDDRLTVPVQVSGSGPFRFLVDTGADRTAISSELVGRLGLGRGAQAAVHSVTGVSMVPTANLSELWLTREPVKVAAAPVFDRANIGADGILGVDSLSSKRVMFDFETQTLSIVPSAIPDFRSEPGTIIVEARRKYGRLVVTDAAANDHPVTVVIDTGAQLSIGNDALRAALVGRGLVDGSQTIQLQSVTGQMISGEYMFIHKLEIGGVVLQDLAIVFADAHTFKELKLDRKPALLLGMNAIRAFKKVSIDFANRKFRVVLPERSEVDLRLASMRLR
jgi:predicted aspartyl protease